MKNVDSVIFDLDGTLWDTLNVAWKNILKIKDKHDDIIYDISREQVRSTFGLPFEECAQIYFGYLEKEKAEQYMKEACDTNAEILQKIGGELYPKMQETIKELSQNFKLYIVSNCLEGYIELFLKTSQLEKYFCDYENYGRTQLSKGENIKLVMERNQIKNAIYIGDTTHDKNAADYAGIPFAYASYGFGDVSEYDYKLNKISDLLEILK